MDTSKITALVNALNTKFENKQSNKKSDITGDFTEDTTSYPTVQAVKSWVATQMANASNLILGETSTTAYRGDRGKTAYDHSQITSGNPHNVTKTDVGLSNVTNVAQAPATHVGDNTHLTTAQKTAINSIADKANSADLATVATTGSYEDLEDTPSLENFIEKSNTAGLVKNDGTIDTTTHIIRENLRHYHLKGAKITNRFGDVTITCDTSKNYLPPFGVIENYRGFCFSFTITEDTVSSSDDPIYFEPTWTTGENAVSSQQPLQIYLQGSALKHSQFTVGASYVVALAESSNVFDLIATNDAKLLINAPSALSDLTNDVGFITSADVPSASTTTPSADTTSGSVGTGTTWARSNHTHPKSSLYAEASHTHGISDVTNLSTTLSGKEDTSNKKANWSATVTNTNYPSEKLVKDSLDNKVDKVSGKGLSTNDFTTTYKNTLDNLSSNLDAKTVTVEKKSTTDAGYIASYVVKQNGAQVGSTINIPKDYLVKSATVGTVSTANNPVTGYQVGDKYLDFVINTKDNTGTDEHLYVNVKDLVDTYTAGSGITLTDGQFSISNGAISKAMLASGVQTSLGYADNWNSSAAKNITSANITAWNNKSNLTTADVDSEIEAYLTAITQALE